MHEINFSLAADMADMPVFDPRIYRFLSHLFVAYVELVGIYNACKTISVNIFSSLLYYCSPFFTELIGLLFQSSALAYFFTSYFLPGKK